jgi:hypothetical protein
MMNKINTVVLMLVSLFVLSGCGVYHHSNFLPVDTGRQYIYMPYYYQFIPDRNHNIQYNMPRNYFKQNINNSININGNSSYEVEVATSKVYFVDNDFYGLMRVIDGTINQTVIEERKKFKIPVCQTAIQSVQASNYNSFQYTSCN